ncbi:MAG: hypothetical protein CVU77_01495 [Elusimicrobia bacterium HGW-Elusimicrobia-1]|jgi:hypothetical protein|nr:MAG: hypothetical protein CVU77_01495 [Elusimicrobia bacterium HGW-Elusimicrobia-1]
MPSMLYAAPVTLRGSPPYAGPPNRVTSIIAAPDFSAPEAEGKIKLNWTAPSDAGGLDVFSYIVKYATFSVADMGGDKDAWWDHPQCITAFDPELNVRWGKKSLVSSQGNEIISVSGLESGTYYYFAVKSVDRYHRFSVWDIPYDGVSSQSNAYATTPPWQPYIVTTLAAEPMAAIRAAAMLEWFAPLFVENNPPYEILPGHIKQLGQYCIQYSTAPPPEPVNRPNQPNNWAASQRIIVSTRNVQSGDLQNYVLTGLSHNTTYYVHLFTKNEWPNKWSYASYPVTTVRPYIDLSPVDDLVATASASADNDIASFVTLSWENPENEQFFAGARVGYSTSSYPSSPDSGNYFDVEPLASGTSTDYAHIRLLPRHNYYYSVWAYDSNHFYSSPRNAQTFTSFDINPPAGVKNITSFVDVSTDGDEDAYAIRLAWSAPDASAAMLYRNIDFDRVRVYVSTTSADPADHVYLSTASASETAFIHSGAAPYTTYYYSFASVDAISNEQTAVERSTHSVYICEDHVPPSAPTIVTHLYTASREYADGCKVALTWRAPPESHFARIVARISLDGFPLSVSDGDALTEWTGLPDATGSAEFKRLVSLTTNYISLFAVAERGAASRPAKVAVYTDIPWTDTVSPHVPRDVRISSSRRVTWSPVKYDANLAAIPNYATPRTDQIYFYEILKSTSMKGPWIVGDRMNPSLTFCDIAAAATGYYKIRAVDAGRNCADSYAFDLDGNIYVAAGDSSYVKVPADIVSSLRTPSNPAKDSHLLSLSRVPADEKGIIYKSVEFRSSAISETSDAMRLQDVPGFSLGAPGAKLAFSYDTDRDSVAVAAPSRKAPSRPEIQSQLGVFYYNGVEWQRINLSAAAPDGYVISSVRFAGKYQLRRAASTGEFAFYDAVPRIITPNNDGINDRAMFRFANPQGRSITLKIYDINSVLVRDIGETTAASDTPGEHIFWDGLDDNNRIVAPGVYVYQLELEEKIINGTIVVAR